MESTGLFATDDKERALTQREACFMGRRRRSGHNEAKSDKELWCDYLEKKLENGATIQVVGIESPTQTAFVRVVLSSSLLPPEITLHDVVEYVVEEGVSFMGNTKLQDECVENATTDRNGYALPSVTELLRLGSVWVLKQKGEKRRPRRASLDAQYVVLDWKLTVIRVHYNPARFPVAYQVDWGKYCSRSDSSGCVAQVEIDEIETCLPSDGALLSSDGAIVYEDPDYGFAILNKPRGIPAHANVNNTIENVVSQFQEAICCRKKESESTKTDLYVSLPQRLDTETSGLLIAATKKEFASYMSKLLQAKTKNHVQAGGNYKGRECLSCSERTKQVAGDSGVTKKYRCLVCITESNQVHLLERLEATRAVVTHYLDPKPSAPRTFKLELPSVSTGWQECQLRLNRVSLMLPPFDGLSLEAMGQNVSGEPHTAGFAELEVELLTGRTHQIRGQLAALGCPIFGDSLYGDANCDDVDRKSGRPNRLALQCCEICFLEPEWDSECKLKSVLKASTRKCVFQLKKGWWSH